MDFFSPSQNVFLFFQKQKRERLYKFTFPLFFILNFTHGIQDAGWKKKESPEEKKSNCDFFC